MASSALDAATKATSLNIVLQVLVRVSSFCLNGFVLHRLASYGAREDAAHLLGLVNVRLTLLYNTVLFLSREALRKAALSRTTEDRRWGLVANLLWLSIPIGIVWAGLLSLFWLSPIIQQPNASWDRTGVLLFALCSLVELAAEPLWVLAQLHRFVAIKVLAEGVPQVLRCLLVALGVVLFPQYGLPVFIIGQLAYSLGYVVLYYTYFMHITSEKHNLPLTSLADILPAKTAAGKWLSPSLMSLSWSFFKQSFLKQLLTDGERYIMTVLGVLTFAEQGVYDSINNLGSLVARFIFLPIEESFYVFFASVLVRGESVHRQPQESIMEVAQTLTHLLKFVVIVALTILAFGYAYSTLALDLYGGSVLSEGEGPWLLWCYCVYVMFLAVNGVSECFVFAAMGQRAVDRYNRVMIVFSAVFLGAAVMLTELWGSVGFILANCINMFARIVHSFHFIHAFFKDSQYNNPLVQARPSFQLLATYGVAFIITALSERVFCCDRELSLRAVHVAIGFLCLVTVGLVFVATEEQLCGFLLERLPVRVREPLWKAVSILTRKPLASRLKDD